MEGGKKGHQEGGGESIDGGTPENRRGGIRGLGQNLGAIQVGQEEVISSYGA